MSLIIRHICPQNIEEYKAVARTGTVLDFAAAVINTGIQVQMMNDLLNNEHFSVNLMHAQYELGFCTGCHTMLELGSYDPEYVGDILSQEYNWIDDKWQYINKGIVEWL